MMISPEQYYEKYLKGKTEQQLKARIRSLRRKIRVLQKAVEYPDPEACMFSPEPVVQLELHRKYLQKATEMLMDTLEYLKDTE